MHHHHHLLFSPARPLGSLTALFVTWKGFLLAVALGAAMATDYDTSTDVFLERMYGADKTVPTLVAKLTRWDALYFMHAAIKGYVFEQEWAFGPGLPTTVSALASWAHALEPTVGVVVSHLSHWIAVLALHRLTLLLSDNGELAFLSAALHIVSPAGLFLSAPYNESPFACLCFVGILLFAAGLRHGRDLALVAAGVVFGLATTFRSNGLTNGLLFAAETVSRLSAAAARRSLWHLLLSATAPVVGGLCVAAGSVVPQAMAWMRYCYDSSEPRPWCRATIPSIYTFVQRHYWNVGFLRYWTLNQVPLFLLAAPMLLVMMASGVNLARDPLQITDGRRSGQSGLATLVRALALSQLAVAVLAITSYHVQIVTRVSSGYPVWYWWLAACLMDDGRRGYGSAIAVFIIMYAAIQGGLFASFLPPA